MADIKMREIEIFLTVARNQNISKAAKELYISQPSISKWISTMEDNLGIELFQRTNRGAILTPEGERLYAQLDVAYNRFRVSVEEIFNDHSTDEKTLRFGCLNRLATLKMMEAVIKDLPVCEPPFSVSSERYNFHELRTRLLCGELDFAITLSSDIEPYSEFDSKPLGDFPTYFLTSPEFHGDLSELSGKSLIIETPTSRGWAEQVCKAHNVTPSDVKYVNSYILLTTLVAAGEGFSVDGRFVTESTYFPDINHILTGVPCEVKIVLAWSKENLSPQAKLLTSIWT